MEIDKRKLKKILTEQREEFQSYIDKQREEFQRYVDILYEKFHSDVKIIVEQYNNLNRKIDLVAEKVVNIDERLTIVETDTRFIKNQLTRKVDREEFEILENRVAILESKIKS